MAVPSPSTPRRVAGAAAYRALATELQGRGVRHAIGGPA